MSRIWNIGIVKVIRSEHPDYKAGDYLYNRDVRAYILIYFRLYVSIWLTCRHMLFAAFAEYAVFTEIPEGTRKLESNEGIPWPAWVGVLGMPGQTSYMGWKEYAAAKKVSKQ